MEWLSGVREILTNAGFRAEIGYPGQGAVALTGTVAAVNLTQVNTGESQAVVTVTILTPRTLGLGQCQEQAGEAAGVLSRETGCGWTFSGWRYESGIDCYAIEVTGSARYCRSADGWIRDSGCQVAIGEENQSYVTDFLARQALDRRFLRPHAQTDPAWVTPGVGGWTIKLTQLFPVTETEPAAVEEPFTLTVKRGGSTQVFSDCYWGTYSSQQKERGTEVVRSGFALSREVTEDGSDEV